MAKDKEHRGLLGEIFDEVDAMAQSALREAEEFTSDAIFGKQANTDDKHKNKTVVKDISPQFNSSNLTPNLLKKQKEWQRYVELKKDADLAQKYAEEAYKKYCEIK